MGIIGVLLMIAGLISTIYGYQMNNSVEAQLNAIFSSGQTNPGMPFIIAGIAALVIGAILLVMGYTKKGKGDSNS